MDSPEYWPLPGLRLRAGRLELRLPDAADLTALAALAEAGVHDPEVQPFSVAWTDVEPAERAISTMRYHWSSLGSWQPSKWTLLALAFKGLGAEFAVSGAFVDNAASLAVSRKLGYVDDGIERTVVRGEPHDTRRLRLDKAAWQAHRTIDVTISGLEPCLPFFGAASG